MTGEAYGGPAARGPAGREAGAPPLVLLHGFTGAPAAWDDVLAALPPARASHALTPPLLGHAAGAGAGALPADDAPPGAPDEEPSAWAAEVDRLADLAAGGPPAHWVGYSLGGRLALGVAARRPEVVARLTLVGARPGLADPAARAARRAEDARWAALLEREEILAFAAAWEALPLFETRLALAARPPGDDPGAAARLAGDRARRRAHDPRGLARALRALGLGAMPDLTPALAQVAVPVDVVVGALDRTLAPAAEALARGLPRARLHVVPGAGHDVPLEAPAALAALLAAP